MSVSWPMEIRFIRLLATRLHEYGTAAHRLEGAVSSVAQRLGCACEVFSTPTSVLLSFRDVSDPSGTMDVFPTLLIRRSPGSIDLGKLRVVDEIAEGVASGALDLERGFARLRQLPGEPPVATLAGQLLAWAVVGSTVAALLGSTWADVATAALLALVTGLFTLRLGRRWQEAGSFEAIVAFGVTVLAYGAALAAGGGNVPHVLIGALIILMPGLDLTVAVTELSTGHLASGTARFAGAVVVLVKLALGVMLATQAMTALGLSTSAPLDPALYSPDWFTWVILVPCGLAFAVLFGAQRRDWGAVVFIALLSYACSFLASRALGSETGIFLAALVVAGVSNAYARWLNRPASIMRAPGIILLVPGSLGYRALNLLFSRDVSEGIEAAVAVAVVLAALLGGLLLGNTLVPPRRHL